MGQYPMIKIYKPRPNWHIKNFKGLQDLVAIPEMEINKNQKQSSKQTKTANKPFNNQITQNEEDKQNKEKKDEQQSLLLPTDSISQTQSQPPSQSLEQLTQIQQIPITSIMP